MSLDVPLTQEEIFQIINVYNRSSEDAVMEHLAYSKLNTPKAYDSLTDSFEFTQYVSLMSRSGVNFIDRLVRLPRGAEVAAVPQMPLVLPNINAVESNLVPRTMPDPHLEQTPPVLVDTPAGPGPLPAPVSDMVEAVQAVVEEELPTWFWLLIGVKAALILFFVYTVFYRKKSVSY
jgi:hypothetical protein